MGLILDILGPETGHLSDPALTPSSRVEQITVVNVPGPYGPNRARPGYLLDHHPTGGVMYGPVLLPVPEDKRGAASGAYGTTHEPRFGQAVRELSWLAHYHGFEAVAIYDRRVGPHHGPDGSDWFNAPPPGWAAWKIIAIDDHATALRSTAGPWTIHVTDGQHNAPEHPDVGPFMISLYSELFGDHATIGAPTWPEVIAAIAAASEALTMG